MNLDRYATASAPPSSAATRSSRPVVWRLAAIAVLAWGLLATGTFAGGGPSGQAQESLPVSAVPNGCVVVADGLTNPRSVAVTADGTLYVSEAGLAGDEEIFATGPDGTPSAEPATRRGTTGRVTRIAPDGAKSTLAEGLPSYWMGGPEYVGPAGIVATETEILLAIGGAGPALGLADSLPLENSVVAIDPAGGGIRSIADIGANERASNPDPNALDSNVYGLTRLADGTIVAADAGGNTVYRIDPATGALSVLAVVPGLPIADAPPAGNPARGGAAEIDPVTTSVAPAPDGGAFIGLLSGGPFPAGGAKILHVAPDGTLSDAATGLNMVVGLATDPNGTLYATQLSTDFLSQTPAPGSVVRILPDGTSETVVADLSLPNGITFDSAGNLYVVVDSLNPPDAPTAGRVLRCEAIATAQGIAATPVAGPATPSASTETAEQADVTLTLNDIFYAPTELTIPADTDVTLRLENLGVAAHDFTVDELGIASPQLGPGEAVTLTINAPAGEYTFYCSITGHRAAGMVGTLIVQ